VGSLWIVALGATALLALLFWELWVCEGAHLGRRFVVWLYDLAAGYYERIKRFDTLWERRFLAEPVAQAIQNLDRARILDVGAGTGRLARSLFQLPDVRAQVVCLEPSARMAARGRSATPDEKALWVRAWGDPLPFPEGCFDLVSCLEVLEFTPRPAETLAELARVLRPAGLLLITNRVGREARWILGRTYRRERFPEILAEAGFENIEVFPWQVNYDLAWARRARADRAAPAA